MQPQTAAIDTEFTRGLGLYDSTMVVIGLVLSVVGLGFFCWLLFTLAVYTLPFFALCGRPHKANYVASCDMWRRGRLI